MFRSRAFYLNLLLTLFIGVGLMVLAPHATFAQGAIEGLDTVAGTAGLEGGDLTLTVAKLIRTVLQLLGIIAVCIVLYGGFVWMTAGGSEEKVSKARRILINGGIGLAVIMLSYAIVFFIISSILGSTGSGGRGGVSDGGGGAPLGGGTSALFTVTGFAPVGEVPIRNVVAQITFSKNVDQETVKGAVTVATEEGSVPVTGTLAVRGNRVSFTPETPCPKPNEDRFCFEAHTSYVVTVAPSIKSTTGTILTCALGSCRSTFKTGDLIDTEDPVAELTFPDDQDGVPVGGLVDVAGHGTDDAGVGTSEYLVDDVTFDILPPTGDDARDVYWNTAWDAILAKVGTRYTMKMIVTDIAGNTDENTIRVLGRGMWCFNDVLDADKGETDIDCGGDPASVDYCGACTGGSCKVAEDCADGLICQAGRCSPAPEITTFSPPSGAPGTYVSLHGKGFGVLPGKVEFVSGLTTKTLATFPACAVGWSESEIVVEVPKDAIDGTIYVTTATGGEDTTDNDAGPLLPGFDVNDLVRPNLCSIRPESGAPTDVVDLLGSGFGAARGGSGLVRFGTTEAGSYPGWSDTKASVTVPRFADGRVAVTLLKDDVASNSLYFTVASDPATMPTISSLSPDHGAHNQYVTIRGTGFGSRLGSVWFTHTASGDRTLAGVDFPQECRSDIWSEREVLVMVPLRNFAEETLPEGTYTVTLETADGIESAPASFTLNTDPLTPSLCRIDPSAGLPGTEVTLYGDRFGTPGTVTFSSGVSTAPISWEDRQAVVRVPALAITGPMSVVNAAGVRSNERNFAVEGTTEDSVAPTAAHYAWSFSTGALPKVPEVVVVCSETQISAVPNSLFTESVCHNALVYAEFTIAMNPATLENAIALKRCTSTGVNPCEDTEDVAGDVTTTSTSVTFSPDAFLTAKSTYEVTISTGAQSATGIALARPVSWTFAAGEEGATCAIDRVTITPGEKTLTEEGQVQDFHALPRAGCVVLPSSDYAFDWSANESYVRVNDEVIELCTGTPTACVALEALAEGTSPVVANERTSAVKGEGKVTVAFTDPYITDTWPNCTEACVNAEVGAAFNTAMKSESVERGVRLFVCGNELCTSLTEVQGAITECLLNEDGRCTGFALHGMTLSPGEFYRVVVSGSTMSVSGVPLIRVNYGADYSWIFRVRDNAQVCAVERIALDPIFANASAVGERVGFRADAFGAADSCSVSGQRLDAYAYGWSFTNPIADEDRDENPDTRVAQWMLDGQVDGATGEVPDGCTASCLSRGSASAYAVCGNGNIEDGEECEDGNVASGDGCSASCLREGTIPEGTVVCGDGARSTRAAAIEGLIGEDCDDGKECGDGRSCTVDNDCADAEGKFVMGSCSARDGDGCSASCLAEGSRSVKATCGNRDIAQDPITFAGEECDDGNGVGGDGCSPLCVHEGSPTLADVNGALCGDGTIDRPFENCDDDNIVSGDGCSAACLLEGSAATCGNSTIDTGEECDDGNSLSGDGCSAACLLEGSSFDYRVPSVCGDGEVGRGEVAACESGMHGDGLIDPFQMSVIAPGASFEVDPDLKRATATIEVEEDSSHFSTTSTLSLSCSATSDRECADPTINGVGAGSCCMVRPTASLFPVGDNVCRNAAIYAVFDVAMNTASFTETKDGVTRPNMYAELDLSTVEDGQCPATHAPLAQGSPTFWKNMLDRVFGAVGVHFASAADPICILPAESFNLVPLDDAGSFAVELAHSELLEPGARYTLHVIGDKNIDDEVRSGVRSAYDVAMYNEVIGEFTTGAEVCALSSIEVTDVNEDSPGFYSKIDEVHLVTATPLSYGDGRSQQITSIPGVYSWEWRPWVADDEGEIFGLQRLEKDPSYVRVGARGENGEATIVATARIVDDTLGVGPEQLSGTTHAIAFLCEHPWPGRRDVPWRDDIYHLSSFYCRDAGEEGFTDDLPGLTVVDAGAGKTPGVLKEYLFQNPDSRNEAIGLRIFRNDGYLSPAAWYDAQGFTGAPNETEVDGFPAVEDGRSTYIAVPNLTLHGDMYPNIVVLSYNQEPSEELTLIYEGIRENLSFLINLEDTRLCLDGSGAPIRGDAGEVMSCVADHDCGGLGEGAICGSEKLRLTRDITRLGDLTTLTAEVTAYGRQNGACSATTAQLCSDSGGCPLGESCLALVPTLPSGTFVRSMAASSWTSWNEILGGALEDDLPKDPLNTYESCGVEGGVFAAYDAATCVDGVTSTYVCPAGSYAYHYRAIGPRAYELSADLEFDNGHWVHPIDTGETDMVTLNVGHDGTRGVAGFTEPFCDGSGFGASSSCGDGVVGAAEVCELGDRGGTSFACDADGDGDTDGVKTGVCASDCRSFVTDPAALCVAPSCGDGIKDAGEECDDGTKNGEYGFCGGDCSYATAFFCGDGMVAGGEACDCGAAEFAASLPSWDERRAAGGGFTCLNYNGEYSLDAASSCAFDCSGAANFCGDVKITDGEMCDGAGSAWGGALCCGGGDKNGETCTSNNDCIGSADEVGYCGYDAAQDAGKGAGFFSEWLCSSSNNSCLPTVDDRSTVRTRTCEDDGAAGEACMLASNWRNTACLAVGSCGDGKTDVGEECDDGNTDSTDSCTATCEANVCGDGFVERGVEQCDEGSENGASCIAAYGSTCTSCSLACKNVISSGQFCGDGLINGAEYCDGASVPYSYFDDVDGVYTRLSCSTLGTTLLEDGITYTCRDVGICNGGSRNGQPCTTTLGISAPDEMTCNTIPGDEIATCIRPSCAESCVASCPFTTSSIALDLTANKPGSRPSESVELHSYDTSTTADLPNAATITVPACTASSRLVADIDVSGIELPTVYTVFVTDTSGSMAWDFEGDGPAEEDFTTPTRIDVAKDVLQDAVSSLFDELRDHVEIGLVTYGSDAVERAPLSSSGSEADLLTAIEGFTPSGVTYTGEGLDMAREMLRAIPVDENIRKVVVLLSDGAPSGNCPDAGTCAVDEASAAIKEAGYEIYTVALTTSRSLIDNMNGWSSNNDASWDSAATVTPRAQDPESGIDYAYNGASVASLTDMYESIVDAITGFTVAVVSSPTPGAVRIDAKSLMAGEDVILPWPSGFRCDGLSEKAVPIQSTFVGEGVIRIENVRVDYCAP